MRFQTWLVFPLIAVGTLSAQSLSKSAVKEATVAAGAVIDDWHLAAAESDEERYFRHMSPEAVFIGIEESQRWTREAFRKWVHPGFQARQVWVFKSASRNITLSPGGDVAWFDELLDTPGMGTARGTGVLVKGEGTWLISQYSLSLPIPLKAFSEVLEVIRAQKLITKETPGTPPEKALPSDK